MIQTYSATTEMFLSDLDVSKTRTSADLEQLSSGYKVRTAADAPADIVTLLQVQNQMAQATQVSNNLSRLQTQVTSGESALDQAISLMQQAGVLGARGMAVDQTPVTFQALASQVQSLQQEMVGLSQTSASGSYIFSGDNDLQAQYTLDPTNTITGVKQAFPTQQTRQIADISGQTFTAGITAQDIFDQTDSSGNPTANNVFAALQQLYNCLTANPPDTNAINQAVSNVNSASTWLNNNLAFYGTVADRISSSTDIASKYQTQWTQQIADIRNADIASVASDLQAVKTQQSAALSAEANFQPQSLFNYLR
jgi:flagellar hook-associated protein 3 FlgL